MNQYSTFVFESTAFDERSGKVHLHYSIDGKIHFDEVVQLPRKGMRKKNIDPELFDRALFNLHLIGGISYYKTFCPKEIIIKSGTLSKSQALFWNELYENGLGEFFYCNNIDFQDLIHFPYTEKDAPSYIPFAPENTEIIVPIGGGKDSLVSIELLKASGHACLGLRMGKHPLITVLAEKAGIPLLEISRTLAPELFTLHEKGALNGHVPITAYVSFLSILTALLYGHSTVVMSNERSANVGSLIYKGKEINHQWSKGFSFEKALQQYCKEFITPDIRYFSLLRPLSELSIVKQFTRYPQYFPYFTSCNTNWKISGNYQEKRWCNMCSKCACMFALFSASMSKEHVLEIFGKNLYEHEETLPLFRKLLGSEGWKPFECVALPQEMQAAFILARERNDWNDTLVMQRFFTEELPHLCQTKELVQDVLKPVCDHSIPNEFSTILSSII